MLFLAGFLLSLLGSLPPGLISLSVAYAAIRRGLRVALWIALGAALVEFGQAALASILADGFLKHDSARRIFQWASLPVFLGLGLYMIFWAPRADHPTTDIKPGGIWQQLGKGALISLFNLLALPYWFSYCGWLHMQGWWPDSRWSVILFAGGVSTGTMSVLLLYGWAGQKIVSYSTTVGKIANRVIGTIFLLLAAKLLLDLFVQY